MAIKRNISVLNQGVVPDIDIVYGSDLVPIEFYITDYVIPSNAIATLYCTTPRNNVYKRVGTILNNVISFEITKGFFEVGKNRLQIRITADEKNLYSFESNVNCKANNATDDASEVKSQPTLVEQLLTDIANTNKQVKDALLEVEETKKALETKVDESTAQLSNPNLFINGNFQIWSNGESFDVYGANNEEYSTAICDRWYAKHYDLENEFVITKETNGLRIESASEELCYIYQVLDEETFNVLQGKTLTLSYSYTRDGEETVEESIENVVGRELNVFTAQTRIGLTSSCVLHWVKLEVGTVKTPCVPDSKDVIVCELEKKLNAKGCFTLISNVTASETKASYSTYLGRKISDYDLLVFQLKAANNSVRSSIIEAVNAFAQGAVVILTAVHGVSLENTSGANIEYDTDTSIQITITGEMALPIVNVYGVKL